MADPNVVAGSFGGGGGARSTPPDFYSTLAAKRQQPTAEKKDNPGAEAIKALQAVFEVFKKLETKLGGKPDPNLDAAKDNLKKFVATTLKQDPAMLEGGAKPDAAAAAPPPQAPPDGSAEQPAA
jgi:hypothetical protein